MSRPSRALLEFARDHGLLAEVEYPRPTGSSDLTDIYDGDTVVDITADGATYTHRAFDLLLGGTESDPQRRALADFLDDADDWLNGDTPRAGGAAAIHSRGVPGAGSTQRDSGRRSAMTPTVEWPTEVSVRLKDVGFCAVLPADEVGDLFADAHYDTLFIEDGVNYRLAIKPQLPGDAC